MQKNLGITPAQTIGPFAAPVMTPNEAGKVNYDWRQLVGNDLVTPDAVGVTAKRPPAIATLGVRDVISAAGL